MSALSIQITSLDSLSQSFIPYLNERDSIGKLIGTSEKRAHFRTNSFRETKTHFNRKKINSRQISLNFHNFKLKSSLKNTSGSGSGRKTKWMFAGNKDLTLGKLLKFKKKPFSKENRTLRSINRSGAKNEIKSKIRSTTGKNHWKKEEDKNVNFVMRENMASHLKKYNIGNKSIKKSAKIVYTAPRKKFEFIKPKFRKNLLT